MSHLNQSELDQLSQSSVDHCSDMTSSQKIDYYDMKIRASERRTIELKQLRNQEIIKDALSKMN